MQIDISALLTGALGFGLTGMIGWVVNDLRKVSQMVAVLEQRIDDHKERLDKEEMRGDAHAVALAEIKGCKSAAKGV